MTESGSNTGIVTSEYTVWTSLSDLSNGVMMVRGYKDINYTSYSFEQFKGTDKPVFKKINVSN